MYNLNWSRSDLTRQKLGTFCEYYAKMSLASYGVSIYTSEVDDHGIDFIAESKRGFLKFQVKAIRKGTGYVFMREEYFDISDQSLYLFLLLLNDGEHPIEYLIQMCIRDRRMSAHMWCHLWHLHSIDIVIFLQSTVYKGLHRVGI